MHSNCFVFPYMQAMGVTELFFVYECGMDNFTSKIFQGVVLMYIIILQVRSFQYYMQIVLKTFGRLFCKAITLSQLQYYQSLIIFLPLNYEVELVWKYSNKTLHKNTWIQVEDNQVCAQFITLVLPVITTMPGNLLILNCHQVEQQYAI